MDNMSLMQGATFALNSGALANGTVNGTIQITAAINYVLDGIFRTKAITNNISIAINNGSQVYQAPAGVGPANGTFTGGVNGSTRLYLLSMDAAGTVIVTPGAIVDSAELAGGRAALHFPNTPVSTLCPFGAIRVALTAGTTFTPGQTVLTAAGVTVSYINLADVPANPLTA